MTTAPFGFTILPDPPFLARQLAAIQQTFPRWAIRAVITGGDIRWTARANNDLTEPETKVGLRSIISGDSIEAFTQELSGQVEIRHIHRWEL